MHTSRDGGHSQKRIFRSSEIVIRDKKFFNRLKRHSNYYFPQNIPDTTIFLSNPPFPLNLKKKVLKPSKFQFIFEGS